MRKIEVEEGREQAGDIKGGGGREGEGGSRPLVVDLAPDCRRAAFAELDPLPLDGLLAALGVELAPLVETGLSPALGRRVTDEGDSSGEEGREVSLRLRWSRQKG